MNITFNKISIKNFMSFDDSELNFDSYNGFISVYGINKSNDGAKSNGSGKSTLFEAIIWCLTGETSRQAKNVKNIFTDGDAEVTLDFTVDSNKYSITRIKGKSSNLKIYINGEDKSGKGIADTSKLLEEYLPDLTSQLISSVIILGQGLPGRFSNNTPSGRKQVLEDLSKSDFMIEDLKERIAKRKNKLTEDLRTNENEKIKLETELKSTKNQIDTEQNRLDNLEPIEKLTSELSDYEEKYNSIEKTLNALREDLSNKIIIRDKLREDYTTISSELKDKKNSSVINYNNSVSNLNNQITALTVEIKNLKKEITRIDNITDICPTCGQKIPGKEKPSSDKEKAELKEKEAIINKIQNDVAEITNKYNEEIKIIDNSFADKINDVVAKGKNAGNDVNDVDNKIKANESDYRNISMNIASVKSKIENHNRLEEEYKNSISKLNDKVYEINEALLYNFNDAENINKHIDVIKKFEGVITRDFRGILLENVIAYINAKCKEYANDIFNNDNLSLELDKNNLNIIYSDKMYENLSGGEKQKVDICVQLALRSMLCSFMNFSSSIIVLDEVTDNLDSIGVDRVFNLITGKLNDLKTVFIISHHKDLQIPYDNEIVIEKSEKGLSKIL